VLVSGPDLCPCVMQCSGCQLTLAHSLWYLSQISKDNLRAHHSVLHMSASVIHRLSKKNMVISLLGILRQILQLDLLDISHQQPCSAHQLQQVSAKQLGLEFWLSVHVCSRRHFFLVRDDPRLILTLKYASHACRPHFYFSQNTST
jgi:hypothetical protein